MIKLARQVFLCANGITRINGGGKELAFALLAACHGGNFALISLDDEVALCHGADSLSQFRCLRHYKELRPKVSQLSRTGRYTQNPCSRHFERNRDFATVVRQQTPELVKIHGTMRLPWTFFLSLLLLLAFPGAKLVAFPSGNLTLHGIVYRPDGAGPFPAVLYNHGSAPGMLSNDAIEALGPLFAKHGWVFFAAYRRGQGLSATAGAYIGDEIAAAVKQGGIPAGAATMIRLLETDHLNDQLAALAWLQKQNFVQPHRIATAGNSFGGIEAILGAARGSYCAAIDGSGGAESWAKAPALQDFMIRTVRSARAPIFFFQAENDYDLSPTRNLSAAMKDAGKTVEMKIYPPYGTSASEGHSFAYLGSTVWGDDAFRFLSRNCKP
jgi:dienelactone hydrolase